MPMRNSEGGWRSVCWSALPARLQDTSVLAARLRGCLAPPSACPLFPVQGVRSMARFYVCLL